MRSASAEPSSSFARRRERRRRMARILIIDDDEILAEVIAERLEAAGHMVSAVHDGGEAVRAIENSAPDLVVLDYDLPGATGLSILREVRRRPHAECMPVLMLTAKTGRLVLARALQDGVDDYVTKPVAPVDLLGRVEALLVGAMLVRRMGGSSDRC